MPTSTPTLSERLYNDISPRPARTVPLDASFRNASSNFFGDVRGVVPAAKCGRGDAAAATKGGRVSARRRGRDVAASPRVLR